MKPHAEPRQPVVLPADGVNLEHDHVEAGFVDSFLIRPGDRGFVRFEK